jgi:hypothetical protein
MGDRQCEESWKLLIQHAAPATINKSPTIAGRNFVNDEIHQAQNTPKNVRLTLKA